MTLNLKSNYLSGLLLTFVVGFVFSPPTESHATEIGYRQAYSKRQLAEIKAQVKMTDLLIRFAKQHPDDVKFLEDPVYFEREIKRQIPEFAEIARQITLADLAAHEAEKLKGDINEALKIVNWGKFRLMMVDVAKSIKGFVRINGIGYASFFALTYAVDIVLHAALLTTKFAYIVAVSAVVPYAAFFTGTLYDKYKNIILRRHLTKLLGGKATYQTFISAQNQLLADLKIKYSSAIMLDLPFGNHKGNLVLTFSPPTDWKGKIKRKLWLDGDKFTYGKMKAFYIKQAIDNDFLKEIDLRKDIPEELKTIFLMKRIAQESNLEIENAFIEKFSAYISELEVHPNYEVHKVWIKKLTRIHSIDEAIKVLELVPEGSSPTIVARAWKNIGIPALARNDTEIPLFKFNNLVNGFVSLEAASELASKESWSLEWLNRYKIQLLFAMNKKCKDYATAD